MPADRERASGPVGAIDCGTNSTRLLILDAEGRRLERRMVITRLGRGVDQTGELAPEAIARTLDVLRQYHELLSEHGVAPDRLRIAATSAMRDAANAADLLDAAEQELGVRPEVIQGAEEGALSFRGATAGLAVGGPLYVVVDVGGGSTEVIVGTSSGSSLGAPPVGPGEGAGVASPAGPRVLSMDVGCVRITERYLVSDPPEPAELRAARVAVAERAVPAARELGIVPGKGTLVGLAGTVSSLTVMALGLEGFDERRVHHARLTLAEVDGLTHELAQLPVADRREVRGMERERADVIVGGGVVLGEVMRALGFDELVASEADILDGMAAELPQR